MRNRYIVFVLTAIVTLALAGCHRNPEVAKRKYYESGMSYMDKKQYEAASIQFKKALQIDPRYADAHYRLGTALLGMQQYMEGYKQADWVLLDYVDFVVHIFSEKARQYYDLERLWKSAKRLEPEDLLSKPRRSTTRRGAPRARKKRAS